MSTQTLCCFFIESEKRTLRPLPLELFTSNEVEVPFLPCLLVIRFLGTLYAFNCFHPWIVIFFTVKEYLRHFVRIFHYYTKIFERKGSLKWIKIFFSLFHSYWNSVYLYKLNFDRINDHFKLEFLLYELSCGTPCFCDSFQLIVISLIFYHNYSEWQYLQYLREE